MATRLLRSLALAAALSGAGCGVVGAQLEARTVCYSVAGYRVPGASAGGTMDVEVPVNLGTDLSTLTDPHVNYTLTLRDVELSMMPSAQLADLGGIEELAVSALPPTGSSRPEAPLARYARGAELHPTRILAASTGGTDLKPYLVNGVIGLHVLASGAPPLRPWAAGARACFVLQVEVQ